MFWTKIHTSSIFIVIVSSIEFSSSKFFKISDSSGNVENSGFSGIFGLWGIISPSSNSEKFRLELAISCLWVFSWWRLRFQNLLKNFGHKGQEYTYIYILRTGVGIRVGHRARAESLWEDLNGICVFSYNTQKESVDGMYYFIFKVPQNFIAKIGVDMICS